MSRIDDLSTNITFALGRLQRIEAQLGALRGVLVAKGLVTDADFEALTQGILVERKTAADELDRAASIQSALREAKSDRTQ